MASHVQEAPLQHQIKVENGDQPRGRRRSRTQARGKHDPESEGDIEGESDEEQFSGQDGPSRKRKRSRKGLDKKFGCPEPDCGKSYSRAEHLYRHQLNHTPKQIYSCDFPECQRTFVRQDLCNRHKERHTAKGAQLQRKDSLLHAASPGNPHAKAPPLADSATMDMARSIMTGQPRPTHFQHPSPPAHIQSPFSPTTTHSSATLGGSGPSSTIADFNLYQTPSAFKRSSSDHSLPPSQSILSCAPLQAGYRTQRHSFGVADSRPVELSLSRPQLQSPAGGYGGVAARVGSQTYQSSPANSQPLHTTFVSQQNLPMFTLPPANYASDIPTTSAGRSVEPYATSASLNNVSIEHHSASGMQSTEDLMLLDQMTAQSTMPVFGEEHYSRSPFAIPDDFVAFLGLYESSPVLQSSTTQPLYNHYMDVTSQYQQHYLGIENLATAFPPQNQQHAIMAVANLLDSSLPESVLSEEKSQEIIDLIKERFNDQDHTPVAKQKEHILEGDRNNDSHVLSRNMMQTYISSYWWNFHPQLPILHKPTFSPDKTSNLLLIAMMAIGASCLDKMYGYDITQTCAELSNFLAWHLRWEIFGNAQSRPPAKLWVFQALLLLEVYEKVYSTRELHERAHIHHATTITLMRRGSSLTGRSALDSPPSVRDEKLVNGSRQSSASAGVATPDDWWNHWITNEATRRAAFAAFVIDSVHATMFGHSAVMVAHEMRLPLPCDETLWSATSSQEVHKIEASLLANGIKPIPFLEGLKRTMSGQEVQTNAFGRSILMAGLLSVSWHMNQRDLQVNSLGGIQTLGSREKWRGTLTRAFDLWKHDFNRSLEGGSDASHTAYGYMGKPDENVVFESRTVLHHLAHMAMHVDIVDCQIYARAKRLLGRTIGPADLQTAQKRMENNWAPTARARDATYYALRFLCAVLLPEEADSNHHGYDYHDLVVEYSARDDVLMNRSWVLYFAALVVWCYGYAVEGPSKSPTPSDDSHEDQVRHMRSYLDKLRSVNSPEHLKTIKGFNECSGILMVLRTTFRDTRWELLHEAAILLDNCIRLNRGETIRR